MGSIEVSKLSHLTKRYIFKTKISRTLKLNQFNCDKGLKNVLLHTRL